MCVKAYANQALLNKHVGQHNYDKAFSCVQCIRSFKSKKVLQRHVRQQHKKVELFS